MRVNTASTHFRPVSPARESTPNVTGRPRVKLSWSNALPPESPEHRPSPATNSASVMSKSERRQLFVGSPGVHWMGTSSRSLRVPSSFFLGPEMPYPTVATVVP